jgi:hypothetical protein
MDALPPCLSCLVVDEFLLFLTAEFSASGACAFIREVEQVVKIEPPTLARNIRIVRGRNKAR